MANVKVSTDDLFSGSEYANTAFSENEGYYGSVSSLSADTCTSFNSFKSKLKLDFNNYEDHSGIMSDKLNLCAIDLEKIDYMIGNNVTSPLESADNLDFNSKLDSSISESANVLTTNTEDFNNCISQLAYLSNDVRTSILDSFYSELKNAVISIENGDVSYTCSSDNDVVDTLVNQFVQTVYSNENIGNDLLINDFYNNVVQSYCDVLDVKATPDMLHYAGRNGYPLIREDIDTYNLEFKGDNKPTKVGDEYNLYRYGMVIGTETKNNYNNTSYKKSNGEIVNLTSRRTYSWYCDYQGTPIYKNNVYNCDDGIYRDADGYVVCADKYNMGYNEDGSRRVVGQITSENAVIVDTPYGLGKVYDYCEAGNIDVYTSYKI